MKQRAYLGVESIKDIVPILKEHNVKHILLVRGKRSYETCGAEQIMNDVINDVGCRITEFYDFSENPKYEDMEKGLALLKCCKADMIIAIGGGSVIDMSKLIRFFYCYKGDVIGKLFHKEDILIPLIAIPTTAGTGAEATHFAVVYKNNVKYSVEHCDVLPDYAVVYPPFTYGNPKYLTACTGFDALAQAIEAYWNLNATDESDIYAERAIKLLWANLPAVVNNPTEEYRNKVSEGSYWAGRAINITKTTAPHAFSYPLTTYYGYPHGHAVALSFPFFMSLNCSERNPDNKRILRLLALLSFSDSTNIMNMMQSYINNIGLHPKSDSCFDIDFIYSQVNLDRLKNNPVSLK